MYESQSWWHELWIARGNPLGGIPDQRRLFGPGDCLRHPDRHCRRPGADLRQVLDARAVSPVCRPDRGTPVFVLVLACFYMAPALGWQISAFQAGALGLTLFCGSHVAEIVRGSMQAIPRGQMEASKAIGLTFHQALGYVLLPQALRQILPTWVNSSTEIVKASTLLSVIGVAELLLSTQQVIARTFMTLEFYLFAGFLFFIINYSIELLGRHIEKRVALP